MSATFAFPVSSPCEDCSAKQSKQSVSYWKLVSMLKRRGLIPELLSIQQVREKFASFARNDPRHLSVEEFQACMLSLIKIITETKAKGDVGPGSNSGCELASWTVHHRTFEMEEKESAGCTMNSVEMVEQEGEGCKMNSIAPPEFEQSIAANAKDAHHEKSSKKLEHIDIEYGEINDDSQDDYKSRTKFSEQNQLTNIPWKCSVAQPYVRAGGFAKSALLRWRLALRTLPWVCVMISFRLAVWYGGNIGGWVNPAVLTSFMGLVTFVCALLLYGVVQDYKEAERLPSELECAFNALSSAVQVGHRVGKRPDAASLSGSLELVERMLLCIMQVLDCQAECRRENFSAAMTEFREAERILFETFISRIGALPKNLNKPIDAIRKAVGRLYIIQDTSYILACYALVDGMIFAALVLTATTNWPLESSAGAAIGFTIVITFLFVYLALLIRDLEDPFRYPADYNWKCYRSCQVLPMSLEEDHFYGGSISMASVTVGFGARLKSLLEAQRSSENLVACVNNESTDENVIEIVGESGKGMPIWRLEVALEESMQQLVKAEAAVLSGMGKEPSVCEGKSRGTQRQSSHRNGDLPLNSVGVSRRSRGSIFVESIQNTKSVRRASLIVQHEAAPYAPSYLLMRWHLFRQTLPAVAVLVAARMAVWYASSNEAGGWLGQEVLVTFTALTVLVCAFLLQGIVADYREAEKMPSDLAAAFQGLISGVQIGHAVGKPSTDTDVKDSLRHVEAMLLAVIAVLDSPTGGGDANYIRAAKEIGVAETGLFKTFIRKLEAFKALRNLIRPIIAIRGAVGRIHIIKSTSYIPAGYALMDAAVFANFIILTLTAWPADTHWQTAVSLTVVIGLLFSYLRLLVLDLEDPFRYPPGYNLSCYNRECIVNMTDAEKVRFGRSVSMYVVIVDVGKQLRRLLDMDLSKSSEDRQLGIVSTSESETEEITAATPWERLKSFFQEQLRMWRLAPRVAPAVGVMVLLRVAVWYGNCDVTSLVDPAVLRVFLNLLIFVSIPQLQGVVADFKEAEKLQSDLAAVFEALAIVVVVGHKVGRERHKSQLIDSLTHVERILEAVLVIVDEGSTREQGTLTATMKKIAESEAHLHGTFALIKEHPGGLFGAGDQLRRMVGRIHVIKKTQYILSGYTLMDWMMTLVFAVITLIGWQRGGLDGASAVAVTVVVTFLFWYMALLIRDLEDPFSFPSAYNQRCYSALRVLPWTLGEEYQHGGSVSMSLTTVAFGHHMQALIQKATAKASRTAGKQTQAAATEDAHYHKQGDDVSAAESVAATTVNSPDSTVVQMAGTCPRTEALHTSAASTITMPFWQRWLLLPSRGLALRWRLAFRAVPFSAGMVGLRFAVWGSGVPGAGISPDVFTTFISLAIVVCMFLLQGVIADYKEAEKMPSEVAASFHGLVTAIEIGHTIGKVKAHNPPLDQVKALRGVAAVMDTVLAVLDSPEGEARQAYAATVCRMRQQEEELSVSLLRLDVDPKGVQKAFEYMRALVNRIYVIKRTSYILAGYTLVEGIVGAVLILILAADWPRESDAITALAYASVVGFLFPFVRFLVSDLEDPFRYPRNYNQRCCEAGAVLPLTMVEEHLYGGSISMTAVAVDFSNRLRERLRLAEAAEGRNNDHGLEVTVLVEKVERTQTTVESKRKYDAENIRLESMTPPADLDRGIARQVLLRCRLVFRCVPLVAVAVAARLAVWYGAGVGGWVDPLVFRAVLPLVTFVSSLLLQGVVADYKEAEKMPSDLAAAFHGLVATIQIGHRTCKLSNTPDTGSCDSDRGKEDPKETVKVSLGRCLSHVERLLRAVVAVLDCKTSDPAAYAEITEEIVAAERDIFIAFHAIGADPGELDGPIATMRRTVGRLNDIQATSYIPAGYCLMDFMMAAALILMVVSDWPREGSEAKAGDALAFTVVVTFLFGYISALMRDLEDPFEYPDGYNRRCYEAGEEVPLTAAEDQAYGGSISMAILTVDFGRQLRDLQASHATLAAGSAQA